MLVVRTPTIAIGGRPAVRGLLPIVFALAWASFECASRAAADEVPLFAGDTTELLEEGWALSTDGPELDFWEGTIASRPQNVNPLELPEPMVFDMIRPLGARQGELEVNVLGVVPLNRRVSPPSDLEDPFGLIIRSPDTGEIEWAPEIEYAIWDNFAVEFELPYEGARLEAYKGALQWTFGTAFNDSYIHGTQFIGQYDIDPGLTTLTFLYLFGIQLDDVWSIVSMLGFRSEVRARELQERTELLTNVTLFAQVRHDMWLGVESNYARAMEGVGILLLMPQWHWQLNDRWTLQTGVGMQFTAAFRLPEASFRIIREF